MRKRSMMLLVVAAMGVSMLAIPAAMAGPGSNQNKDVFPIIFDAPGAVDCGEGSFLDVSVDGWVQVMVYNDTNKHIDRAIFHVEAVFTNSAGDTFRYIDVGPDKFYMDKDGNLVHTVTGRPADGGGFALSGHMVFVNDELVSVSGNVSPTDADQACDAIG